LGQSALLGGGGRLGQPDGGLPASVGDFLGQPLQLLAGAGVQGQGDQAVLANCGLVCQHGAAKSMLAAALLEHLAQGWWVISFHHRGA
jgi:hypothetical protein